MKNVKTIIGLAAMALCLGFASCSSDDDAPSYSNAAVSNSELMTILKAKGYQFDENGKMLLDDKANSTTSLDLSGTKVDTAALKELSVFPNLKELNLSSNGYGETFDFSVLPAQITGIDLTNNDIYNYDNLVKVTVEENGDETVENVHNITKLYLPEEAKYNIAQLMRFYRQNKSAIDGGTMDVEMQKANGSLEKYNTLREIPDAALKANLKQNFSNLFEGDKINLNNYIIDAKERINSLYLTEDIKDYEGIQYIVENPYWKGASIVIVGTVADIKIPSLNLSTNVNTLTLYNVAVDKVTLPEKSSLRYVSFSNVADIKTLDLRKSVVLGQRTQEEEMDASSGSGIMILDCPSIESIVLPEKDELRINYLDIECLPNLKEFDMSRFVGVSTLLIGDLPDTYNLVYPNLQDFSYVERDATSFGISVNSFNKFNAATDAFIKKYYKMEPARLSYTSLNSPNNKKYRWNRDYK